MAGREHRRHDIAHERRRRLAEGLRPLQLPSPHAGEGEKAVAENARSGVRHVREDCACLLEILDGVIELPAGEMVASDRVESPGLVLCVGVPPSETEDLHRALSVECEIPGAEIGVREDGEKHPLLVRVLMRLGEVQSSDARAARLLPAAHTDAVGGFGAQCAGYPFRIEGPFGATVGAAEIGLREPSHPEDPRDVSQFPVGLGERELDG